MPDMDEMMYSMECENFQAPMTEFSKDCGYLDSDTFPLDDDLECEVWENQRQISPSVILDAQPLSVVPVQEEELLRSSTVRKVESRCGRRTHMVRGQWSAEEDRSLSVSVSLFLLLFLYLSIYLSIYLSLFFSPLRSLSRYICLFLSHSRTLSTFLALSFSFSVSLYLCFISKSIALSLFLSFSLFLYLSVNVLTSIFSP